MEYKNGDKNALVDGIQRLHEQRLEKEIPAGLDADSGAAGASSAEVDHRNRGHSPQDESNSTAPLGHTEAEITLREIIRDVKDTHGGGTYVQSPQGSETSASSTIRPPDGEGDAESQGLREGVDVPFDMAVRGWRETGIKRCNEYSQGCR